MNSDQDTEITLGMGRMLVLFFALVGLCGLFFGLGFKLGRGEAPASAGDQAQVTQINGGPRPSASKNSVASSSVAKPAKATEPQSSGAEQANTATGDNPAASSSAVPAEAALASSASYYVQVAAVSKQEDAEALVDALKKKQYAAVTTAAPTDKLFHVQVGPFGDIKDAESMRARLTNDGYNPILKK